MQWTKDKPTEDGYYFYKNIGHLINEVCLVSRQSVMFISDEQDYMLSQFKGEWIGPFTPEDLITRMKDDDSRK